MDPSVTVSGMVANNFAIRKRVHSPSDVRIDSKVPKAYVQTTELHVLAVTSAIGKHYAFEVSAPSHAGMVTGVVV